MKGRLEKALVEYELSERAFLKARADMRDAVRGYLATITQEHGDGIVLARKLGVSVTQLSNLKHGYSIPSAKWAKGLLEITL
jgi:hypothetical protein